MTQAQKVDRIMAIRRAEAERQQRRDEHNERRRVREATQALSLETCWDCNGSTRQGFVTLHGRRATVPCHTCCGTGKVERFLHLRSVDANVGGRD